MPSWFWRTATALRSRGARSSEPEAALLPGLVDPEAAAVDVAENHALYTVSLRGVARTVHSVWTQATPAERLRAAYPDVSVHVIPADGALDDLDLAGVGFVALAAGGRELYALERARRLLQRERPVLLVALANAPSVQRAEHVLEAFDYRGFFLEKTRLRALAARDPATVPAGRTLFVPERRTRVVFAKLRALGFAVEP